MRRDEPFLMPAVSACAARQRGVFSSQQALDAGHSERDIQRLRRGGHLVSIRRGVYTLRSVYESEDSATQHQMRVFALSLALTSPAVLSHESAAMELDLALLHPDISSLHVTRPTGLGSRREAGVTHHVAEVPIGDVVTRSSCPLPLTSVARTAIDVARDAQRLECAVAATDSALRSGVARDQLEAVMDRCRSWPGARLAGGAVALADGRADNPGESWSRVVLIAQGVPPDDLQVPIHDGDGLIGYADFGWDGVLGEFDGKTKYQVSPNDDPASAAAVVWKEKRREDRLRVGYEVVRWGFADLYQPDRLGQRVRAALSRAAASGRRTRLTAR